MIKGMMWFDDDKKLAVEEKIARAVEYYQEKYGANPTLCCVSDKMVDQEFSVEKVAVRPQKFIRPQHFWIGIQA